MSSDSYGANDKQAKCSECGKFMPWTRSRLVEKSDGMPCPSPVYVEIGMCEKCEGRIRKELAFANSQAV